MDREARREIDKLRKLVDEALARTARIPARFGSTIRRNWRVEMVTSTQTWTVPAGSDGLVIITAVGGGGGGGGKGASTESVELTDSNGDTSTLTIQPGGGAGGQAGSWSINHVLLSPGTDLDITIGAGGAGAISGDGASGGDTVVEITVPSGTWTLTCPGGCGGDRASNSLGATNPGCSAGIDPTRTGSASILIGSSFVDGMGAVGRRGQHGSPLYTGQGGFGGVSIIGGFNSPGHGAIGGGITNPTTGLSGAVVLQWRE